MATDEDWIDPTDPTDPREEDSKSKMVPSLLSMSYQCMVKNMSEIEFVDYDDLDRILRIVHDTQLHKQIMLPLHRKNIMMSWWYAHLYALQEHRRALFHPEYKDITSEATVEAHGGLVPYTRHALCFAQTIFKTIEHRLGKQAMADQSVWGRTALPSAGPMGGLRDMLAIKDLFKPLVCSRMRSIFNHTDGTWWESAVARASADTWWESAVARASARAEQSGWCIAPSVGVEVADEELRAVASVAEYRRSFEPVYYSTHFNIACNHFWHEIMEEDIDPQWAPNLYFRKRGDRFEVQVGRFRIQM